MVEEARRQTADEPELQTLMLEVLQRPDVVPRLSDAFAKLTVVPAESMPYCLAFIRSDTAKAALGVAAKLQSNAQLNQALQALPASQLAELGKFMESPCAQAPVAAMTSDAGKALSYRFGSEMVCEYVQRERPEKMGYMRENGKCLAAP